MDINQLVENALEFGFEKIKEKSTIKGIEYETYEYKTDFWVRGEHSYDMVNIYLLVNYEKEIGYLCYSPSIAYCIPPTDKQEFISGLMKPLNTLRRLVIFAFTALTKYSVFLSVIH